MPSLHIQLLGNCQLVYADQPLITVNSARLRALLTYLLLHTGVPQPHAQVRFAL